MKNNVKNISVSIAQLMAVIFVFIMIISVGFIMNMLYVTTAIITTLIDFCSKYSILQV